MSSQIKKIVLAYSGGLDTSIILKWLQDEYEAEIIAYCADVGQKEELSGLDEKALKTGATKCYIEDLREEFVQDYVFKAIRANAIYEGKYLLGTSLARPVIAKKQIEIAEKEGADAVAHGATGKGNDQVRFELTFKALNPSIKVIAPWRQWKFKSRNDLINYAKEKNIPVGVSKEKPYSMDRNALHISYEGGVLEDPYNMANEDMFLLTSSPEKAPNDPEFITIDFEKGYPVAVNGEALSAYKLLDKLNAIAGKHGIGRVDIVENRLVGMKSRGVYETPGGTVLQDAHLALETLVLERGLFQYKQQIALKYAELAYNGQWFHPLMEALDAFIDKSQEWVSGVVRLKLFKGQAMVVGRKSPYSLYNPQMATFEEDDVYNQADAGGFIQLFGLPMVEAGRRKRDHQK